MNHNEIQKWCTYLSGNIYITSGTERNYIPLLPLDRYLLLLSSLSRYLPRCTKAISFYHYIWKSIYCQILSITGNHTTSEFCLDPLNSINSAKVIRGKLECSFKTINLQNFYYVTLGEQLCTNIFFAVLSIIKLTIVCHYVKHCDSNYVQQTDIYCSFFLFDV